MRYVSVPCKPTVALSKMKVNKNLSNYNKLLLFCNNRSNFQPVIEFMDELLRFDDCIPDAH